MTTPRLILTLTGAMNLGPGDLAELPPGALELRLDRFDCTQLAALLGEARDSGALGDGPFSPSSKDVGHAVRGLCELCPGRELVVTCAPATVLGAAGGFAANAPAERLELLEAASAAGAGLVDLDPELVSLARERDSFAAARVILSVHPQVATQDLGVALDRALEHGLEVAREWPRVAALKLVPLASSADATDGVLVLDWLASRVDEVEALGLELIAFGAGSASTFTRSLATALGSSAVYAAAAEDPEQPVPGQPTAAELVGRWPMGRPPRRGTPVFGVLGHPVGGSLSPELFTRLFELIGRPSVGVYERFDLEDPGVLFERITAGGPFAVGGLSVTAPHKGAAWMFGGGESRAPEPGLERLGALNTLVPDGQGWRGANTDLVGVRHAVEELLGEPFESRPRELVVLGAGGAARAVLAALGGPRWSGRTVVLARDARRAMALAREFGAGFGPLSMLAELEPELLIHATPAGSHAAPAGGGWLPGSMALAELAGRAPGCRILDANYAPDPTPLVGAARALGLKAAGGRGWFLAQALAQLELFVGAEVDHGAAATCLEELLSLRARPRVPVVLMGLRGAGKSTLGAGLAAELGRPFVDLDVRLAKEAGAESAGALFAFLGEAEFRRRETELFERVLEDRGVVVAAGGGLLTSPVAQAAFGAAAALGIWLDADDQELARRVEADPALRPALFGQAMGREAEAARARAERSDVFRRLAGAPFDTGRGTPDGILAELVQRTVSSLHPRQQPADDDVSS